MNFIRTSFLGGMNLQVEPTKLADGEYPLLINGRNREGTIRPIKKPVPVPGLPEGNYQGLFAANELLAVVISGNVYMADTTLGLQFNRLIGATLDPNVPTVYAALVPKSTLNFARDLAQVNAGGAVGLTTAIPQTAACAVVQDGISQPLIIETNKTVRVSQNYNQWNVASREYVPIGTVMLHTDSILYIISSDGRDIYRSIKGRPLDFMINVVTKTGDKLPLEQDGGASTVSHAVGYDQITCLGELNSSDNPIFVGTNRYSVKMVPTTDAASQIFGQPRFSNITLMPTGPVNHISFTESNGDNLFINTRGIRSFNAALQMRNRGDNAPFSRKVGKLFRDLVQSGCCCIKFSDYVLFAITTVFGPAVLVYDELTGTFVGLDIYEGVGAIKQFAQVTINNSDRLFFITHDNHLYEAFASTAVENCRVYIGEFCSGNPRVQVKPSLLHFTMVNPFASGTISITPYVNRKPFTTLTRNLAQGISETLPETIPFTPATSADGVQSFGVDLNRCNVGWKFGVMLEWQADAELSTLALFAEEQGQPNPAQAEAKEWYARK